MGGARLTFAVPEGLPKAQAETCGRMAQVALAALWQIYSAPSHVTTEQMRHAAMCAAEQCAELLKAEEQ